jgi:hypothetical protein
VARAEELALRIEVECALDDDRLTVHHRDDRR